MPDFLIVIYPWIKAFHIICVIAWMAGMLYLPRLFVYHTAAEVGSVQSETFKTMERKLLRMIINPAMIGTWVFGLYLASPVGTVDWGQAYMWLKLVLVLIMSGVHGILAASFRKFATDTNTRTEKFWRIFNEIPAVIMIGIVILIVVRPF